MLAGRYMLGFGLGCDDAEAAMWYTKDRDPRTKSPRRYTLRPRPSRISTTRSGESSVFRQILNIELELVRLALKLEVFDSHNLCRRLQSVSPGVFAECLHTHFSHWTRPRQLWP